MNGPPPDPADDGWHASAAAWIAEQGDAGDYARQFVLDPALLARVDPGRHADALDVGCGEGRFCRLLRARGIRAVGVDPTGPLLDHARRLDPGGDYRPGRAESLAFADASFDLVVTCLTLLDITDVAGAIAEMARVLRPGGALLVANLNGFFTAGRWEHGPAGVRRFHLDRYADARAEWAEWSGIRVINWHRPLGTYMALLLDQGLRLRSFAEPDPVGGDAAAAELYRRVPWLVVMEWEKPLAPDGR